MARDYPRSVIHGLPRPSKVGPDHTHGFSRTAIGPGRCWAIFDQLSGKNHSSIGIWTPPPSLQLHIGGSTLANELIRFKSKASGNSPGDVVQHRNAVCLDRPRLHGIKIMYSGIVGKGRTAQNAWKIGTKECQFVTGDAKERGEARNVDRTARWVIKPSRSVPFRSSTFHICCFSLSYPSPRPHAME